MGTHITYFVNPYPEKDFFLLLSCGSPLVGTYRETFMINDASKSYENFPLIDFPLIPGIVFLMVSFESF